MSWLRIDDAFSSHPKILGLGTDQRRWTWLKVLTYTCRYRSPIVPANISEEVPKASKSFVDDCVDLGLIDRKDDGTLQVHDWHDYQAGDPKKALRQAKWRKGVDASVDADVDAVVDADVDASRVGARARPVPSPTQTLEPEGSSGKETSPKTPRPLGAMNEQNGHESLELTSPYFALLHAACGSTTNGLEKLLRAARNAPEAAIVGAYEAAIGPGVKDPLAVALSELKKRKSPELPHDTKPSDPE